MRAVCWNGKKDIRVETVSDPRILNPRDAIVEIELTAICGSDLHLYNGNIPTMESGDILGHEFLGRVMEVGPEVDNLQPAIAWRFPSRSPAAAASTAAARPILFATIPTPTPGWRKNFMATRPPASSVTRT
jgi:NADPH:quinone reductase-like Zn-dependent oxidoreductase